MKLNGNTSKRSAAARREAADFAAQERSAHRSGANRSAQSEAAARRAAAQAVVHRFRAGRKHFHHRFQIFFPLALRRDKYNLFEIERSKAVALAVRVHQTHLYRVEIFFHKVARQLIQRFKAHLRGAQPLIFYRLIDKRRKHVARGNLRFAEFFAVVFEHPRQHNEIFRCHVRAGDLFDTHARPAVEVPRWRNCLHKQKFLVGVFHKSRKKRSLVLSRQRHGQPRFRNFLKKIRHTFFSVLCQGFTPPRAFRLFRVRRSGNFNHEKHPRLLVGGANSHFFAYFRRFHGFTPQNLTENQSPRLT